MSSCHTFRPIPGQCGPRGRGPLPAPPFAPQDYWATKKFVSSLFESIETKIDKFDVVDPSAEAEAGKAADAKSTYEELNRILGVASDAQKLAESKADQSALEAHVASTNNPHAVTAEQVGAYTKDEINTRLDEKADKATTVAGYGITDAATKTEIAAKADLVGGKIPAAQLPSYVDDVLEYDTMSAFPATGESGKIYVAKDTNLVYRWSGTQYVEISPSPAFDNTVTETSQNGVKSSGIWSWVKSLLPSWLTPTREEPPTQAEVSSKYTKPSGGIPDTDMTKAVKTSLGLANTALQKHQDISGKLDNSSLANKYSASSAYTVGQYVFHDGSIYRCTTAIALPGEAWNPAHWSEAQKLDDFFTESNSLLNARITYERNATGLKDRAFNALTFDGTAYNLSTALAAVTPTASGQPRDLLIVATATAATTISFTAGTIKGDKPTIDGAGTWLITLTEYASGVWYCRQIKMEDAA